MKRLAKSTWPSSSPSGGIRMSLTKELTILPMREPGMRVAVACSGGADSVALLRLLDELKERLGLRLLVAHLNHQLRGAESDADEGFVRQLAERLGLECVVQREDVAARAMSNRLHLEEAGRQARMDLFASLIAEN